MTIHIATMPDYAGDGLTVLAETEEKARALIRAAYHRAEKKANEIEKNRFFQPGFESFRREKRTWKEAQEYYGLNVHEVELGKAYALGIFGTGWEV